MALNDGSLKLPDEFCDRRIIFAWNRLHIKEAAAVVKLHLARGWQSFQGVGDLARNGAGCDFGTFRVFFHRSHMTQRQGHSRLVRKMVATGTTSPLGEHSSSTKNA